MGKRTILGLLCLLAAGAVWLPCVHLLFRPDEQALAAIDGPPTQMAQEIARRQLTIWRDESLRRRQVAALRRDNPEWDFMWRTYMVLSLGNMALREPDRQDELLATIDEIIADTLRAEREGGLHHYLMSYSRREQWAVEPPRSAFVDGEIALMLAARRLVREHPPYRPILHQRIEHITRRMQQSPVLFAESYPNECWTFCNSIALAATRIADVLDGTDHSLLRTAWVAAARRKLIDEDTGLLISSCTVSGQHGDGPEGSSIWMVTHCLRLVDEPFAREQYDRASAELGDSVLGFGYSREWPASRRHALDVDSGNVIPVLGASPSASGLAMVPARSFDDASRLASLVSTLRLGGMPLRHDEGLTFAAGNAVGDAVVLYGLVNGPLWEEVPRRDQ
jgi:hypothetical protein